LTDVEREFQLEQSIDDSFSSEPATPSESKRTPSDEQWKPWLHAAAEQVVPADFDRPVEDVVAFYERVLRQYPVHPTDRFLHQFYQYHTPPEFANLYENNLQLRSVLHSVVTDIEAALQDSPQLADFERHREEFGRHLSEFHLELFGTESLAATGEAVVRATEPIEEMLIALAAMNATDLTAEHKTVAEEVRDFFYYVVWRYPALNVSIETAQGPNADELIDERRETFESFESTVTERTAEIEARLTEVGLVPGVDDYPDRGDGVLDDTIGDFLSVYQNRSG
jgi:sulfur relay (sulfurtransferase) DsrC/TusE family protein